MSAPTNRSTDQMTHLMSSGRRTYSWKRWVPALTALLIALVLPVGPAYAAEYGVMAFDGQVTANRAGDPFKQAGGVPYAVTTTIEFARSLQPVWGLPFDSDFPNEPTKDIFVDVPPGLVGDPRGIARCSSDELKRGSGSAFCPPASQVGTVNIRSALSYNLPGRPVFNMDPPPGVPARFAFNILGTIVTLDAKVRGGGDYGLTIAAQRIPPGLAVLGTDLTLWGIPAHRRHDPDRACPGRAPPAFGGESCEAGIPPRPFLRLPTRCTPAGVGLPTRLRTDSWFNPGDYRTASFVSHDPPGYPLPPESWGPERGPENCEDVPFDGVRLDAAPKPAASPGASGWTFDLTVPQDMFGQVVSGEGDDLIAISDLKKAVVRLPEGVRVSPSSAQGLLGCSSDDIGLDSERDASCPDASKLGTLRIDTPLLEEPMTGAVYLAKPFDNPFRSLIAIYLVGKGSGVVVKIPGKIDLHPQTGQVTATFDNNPQLPFSRLHLEFFGGSRAALSNPPRCGTYTTQAELTSWSGKTVTYDSSFTTTHDGRGAPCPPRRFSPGFVAGSANPAAGNSSSFLLSLTRGDDDDELGSLTVDMPPGLLAKVADVELCSEANARAGTCGPESAIGTVTSGAGPGSTPLYLPGKAYLGGPYKGAPFNLIVEVPAIAGPFDLGTVVVRSAIHVDRRDATLRVVTDPLPTILEGIPLQIREVRVTLDRPGFMVNPTNCDPMSIRGLVRSVAGTAAQVSSRYQAASCAALPLGPRMTLRVGDRKHTKMGRRTPLVATLRQPLGQAALRSVSVALPSVLNAHLPVVNRACTPEQFAANDCERARTGTAIARTPLLREPLRGSVYFVRPPGQALPDLVVALRGQVDFDLYARIRIPGGKRLETHFTAVPDVPVTEFQLRMLAGRQGAVGAAANLCSARAKRAIARVTYRGQNGRAQRSFQRLVIQGCGKRASGRKATRAAARRAAARRAAARETGRRRR